MQRTVNYEATVYHTIASKEIRKVNCHESVRFLVGVKGSIRQRTGENGHLPFTDTALRSSHSFTEMSFLVSDKAWS